MKKSIKSELNKYLKEMDNKELIQEINKLYSKFSEVKKYYEMELTGDTTAIVEEYKTKIKKEYFPTRGYGQARNSVSRKIVNDFKKISVFDKDIIDLLLYRVEIMLDFTMAYGDIDEAFYSSLESSFEEAMKLIAKEKLQDDYEKQCKAFIKVSYNFGWGVYDNLTYLYQEYFES
ncbi:MAG: DUF6155 family protein [Bacteroidota bacterium]